MKIISVHWVDSVSTPGWQKKVRVKTAKCHSVGFLVSENKQNLTLALSRSLSGFAEPFCDTMTIPKVAITKRKTIKP